MKLDYRGLQAMKTYYSLNSFRLCVDEKKNNLFIGKVYTPLSESALSFNDLPTMVLIVDKVFDENNYPKSYQNKRSFTANKINNSNEQITAKRSVNTIIDKFGKLNTFDIIVTSRQHTCWQGIIKTPKGKIIASFKSDLSLIDFLTKSL